jgi:hypothetical protein
MEVNVKVVEAWEQQLTCQQKNCVYEFDQVKGEEYLRA